MTRHNKPTPLWAVLAVTIINSFGTGVVIQGIFFFAKNQYAFSEAKTFLLGVLIGLTYIPSALAIGPVLQRLARHAKRFSTRGLLAAVTFIMAAVCALPILTATPGDPSSGEWAIWVFVLVYAPICGIIWPITETYVSGGRRAQNLSRTIGRFNIAWSASVAAAFWLIAPYVKERPLLVIAALGAVQLLGCAFLLFFTPEPAQHVELHEPHPPSYRKLLTIFRLQLPASYVVLAALSSYIPFTLQKLNTAPIWETPVTSTWMLARIAIFALMGATHAWHGKWWTTWVGGILVILGFASVICSALAPGANIGISMLLLGLATFGIGAGIIYCSALYYVMEVGHTQVAAGGSHEALIGTGYALGPLCGLAAVATRDSGLAASVEWPMVAFVTLVASAFALYAFWKARRP